MNSGIGTVKTDTHGRELKEHGTPLFPIACYDDLLENGGIPWHWHEECEVSVMVSGQASVFVDGKEYVYGEGEGFFINSGVLHSIQSLGGTAFHYRTVVFHPRLVSGGVENIIWLRYVEPLIADKGCRCVHFDGSDTRSEDAIRLINGAWEECVAEREGYEFRVREPLSKLFYMLSGNRPKKLKLVSERGLRDEDRIKVMLCYIHEHYSEELLIGDIAKCASVSKSECLRCFHRIIGVTPLRYAIRYRIEKAAELLSESELKIMDIGAMCGFQDMSYFARTFRKLKGCTPAEYRDIRENGPG